MAHHQRGNYEKVVAAQGHAMVAKSCNTSAAGDEELSSDVDEPPEKHIQFTKLLTPNCQSSKVGTGYDYLTSPKSNPERKESLLTQALLSSPDMHPVSDAEAPMLTSDGGLTSPARTTTPSPPLPMSNHDSLSSLGPTQPLVQGTSTVDDHDVHIAQQLAVQRPEEVKVEAGLGRKRCITFACGRQTKSQDTTLELEKPREPSKMPANIPDKPKRPCMLKFVCPMRPSRTERQSNEKRRNSPAPAKITAASPEVKVMDAVSQQEPWARRDSNVTIKPGSPGFASPASVSSQPRKGKAFNRIDFQDSEATRFHEFGGPLNTEDEWTNEQTAYRQRITINDTLRKENAIRKLAEEAEEEALEEDSGNSANDDDDDADEGLNDSGILDEDILNDGNESDDEEGFADSDDDSDEDSDYHFWTPGLTTAATSTDHLEHIRPMTYRSASECSIESKEAPAHFSQVRASSPDLPDSSDFVIGTIDEDRALEDAYASCLEQRRRSRRRIIPQDIDPSFPTSDPEADKEDRDCDEDSHCESDSKAQFDHRAPLHLEKVASSANTMRSCNTSPHRAPLPFKRNILSRSPPPRRLFAQTAHRFRSPPPLHRRLHSPPPSRRSSFEVPTVSNMIRTDVTHLAQRPNLTHTTSLPRTPNPFWGQHRKLRFQSAVNPSMGTSPRTTGHSRMDIHSRGPIDIVQGLETKRQRRKEKFWLQHCRAGHKEKVRCNPGIGAERMKELGLEMRERVRGYGQKAQLVLSV